MMNDTTKEYNGTNTYTNKVCHTLRLEGSWNLATLNSRVGEGAGLREEKSKKKNFLGGGGGVFLRETLPHWPSIQIGNGKLQKFSHAMMRQLLLHSILLSYFTSKIFLFFSANKSKHTTSNLKYLKRQKVGRGHLIFFFKVIRGMLIPIYTLRIQNIKF